MPQATQPRPTEGTQDTAQDGADERKWQELVKRATEGDSPGARQVARAVNLEKQRAELMKKVGDNREYLRLMDRNEELNEAQAEFLDVFYPEKEKGERRSQEEVAATRKAREIARKNGS